MGMLIDDIKHCLKVMVDCEVCEECNLYGTTGTDHCEHDCICGALDIIDKYQLMQANYENRLKADMVAMLEDLKQDFIAEAYGIEMDCTDYVVNVADIDKVIQQKIDALKAESEDNNAEVN